jgi:hypothetical protein
MSAESMKRGRILRVFQFRSGTVGSRKTRPVADLPTYRYRGAQRTTRMPAVRTLDAFRLLDAG